ncbi:hypothetical protein F3Y22_tig00111834pilonHSYRG00197 [Hibiscus syriacus]|uniref:Uncharacterized protein n=1 Tax=Hibiscus syriacus TaxID=106335 RepID=A0A6A2XB95_HIBSY|nr:hypothetical protein F3Y22_tig00111834pilonHSYRG00197 [Hibiscus syriacus]
MDHKTWLWRKRTSAKTIVVATDKVDISSKRLDEEDHWKTDCMRQLNFIRDEQERRVCDAVAKTSSEFETAQKALQDKLTDPNKRLEELSIENSPLSKALLVKEELIEDQLKLKSRLEAEFSEVMDRLELTEKENAFLKYEFLVLEKEVEIRNEEMEYNQAAVAKMKNEVEMPVKDKAQKSNNLLLEQLRNVEEENKTLREIMTKKNAQIQSLSSMSSQTSSRPTTEFEIQPKDLFKEHKSMELIRIPEMRLMDDIVEIKKLALSDGKALVPFEQGHRGFSNTRQMQSKDVAGERSFDWLQVVLQAISQHERWKSPNMSSTTDSLGEAPSVDTSAGKTKG